MKNNSGILSTNDLIYHLSACKRNDRVSQKLIYSTYYNYAISIIRKYCSNPDDIMEIVNDGFLKIFTRLPYFTPLHRDAKVSFSGWLSKIMMRTAIDHFRSNQKHRQLSEFTDAAYEHPSAYEDAVEKISHQEILQAVKNISPAYQSVFSLFILDGFSHAEIADRLHISTGTSKSNLSKAKGQLRTLLAEQNDFGNN